MFLDPKEKDLNFRLHNYDVKERNENLITFSFGNIIKRY